jgi:hypothetical protein
MALSWAFRLTGGVVGQLNEKISYKGYRFPPEIKQAILTQDAMVQEPGLRPEISLNLRSHLQYLQRPSPSDFSQNIPSLSCIGYRHVARGSRGRLKLFET